jgi:hypothetical protein
VKTPRSIDVSADERGDQKSRGTNGDPGGREDEDVIRALLAEPVVLEEVEIQKEEKEWNQETQKIVARTRDDDPLERVYEQKPDRACHEDEEHRMGDALPLPERVLRDEVYEVGVHGEFDEPADQGRIEHEFSVLSVRVDVEDAYEEHGGEEHDAVVEDPAGDENDRPFRQ